MAPNGAARRSSFAPQQTAPFVDRRRHGFNQEALAPVGFVRQWPLAHGSHAFEPFAVSARTWRARPAALVGAAVHLRAHALANFSQAGKKYLRSPREHRGPRPMD